MKFFTKIGEVWTRWGEDGLRLPFAHDPVKKSPSVTLLFFYLAYFVSLCAVATSSVLLLVKGDYVVATIMPMLLLFSTFVFYRLRRLDSVKIDFDDKYIDIKGSGE